MKIWMAIIAAAMLAGTDAQAATFKYKYVGGEFDTVDRGPGDSYLGLVHYAVLALDERALGQSLKNAKLDFYMAAGSFSLSPPQPGDQGPIKGIRSFRWGIADSFPRSVLGSTWRQRAVGGSSLRVETDAEGNIVRGCYSYRDGPPDGSFGCGAREGFYTGFSANSTAVSGPAGSWTTVAIPLPAAGLLLLSSVLGLAVVGKRHARLSARFWQ